MAKDDDRFPELPDLPSDEELGIAGLEEELAREGLGAGGEPPGDPPASPHAEPSAPPRAGSPPPPPPPASRPRKDPEGGAARPAGRSWLPALVTLVVLLAAGWLGSGARSIPAPVAANAPDTLFSSARAMTHLVELARGPRPLGSPGHTRARELLVGWLEELGLEPQVETSVTVRRGGGWGAGAAGAGSEAPGSARAYTVRNVLVRIPGVDPTGAVLLTAHYDAVPLSHGAGDDGVGVVAIVEAARALLSGPPLANDLILLFTDAEETGLVGARAFVERHPWMDEVRLVLSAEMRGGRGPVEMFETGDRNGWIVERLAAFDPHPSANSLSVAVYRRMPNDTDFTPFREAGIQGLNFAGIEDAWIYHQASDRPEHIDEGTLQQMGARLLALARGLGNEDLSGEVHAPDRAYLTLPFAGIRGYPASLALPVTLLLVLGWITLAAGVVVRGKSRPGGRTRGWPGVGLGALLGLLLLGGGAGLGWGLGRLLPRFHAEVGSMTPMVYGEEGYLAALLAGVVALALVLLFGMRRWVPLAPLLVGVGLPVGLVVVAVTVAAPLGAISFQAGWAALLVGTALLLPAWGREPEAPVPAWGWILVLVPAVAATWALQPVLEGLLAAMGLWVGVAIGALAALLVATLLPALQALGSPNRWSLPLGALLLAGGLLGWGLFRAGPTGDRPHPSTLLYLLDRGTVAVAEAPEPGGEVAHQDEVARLDGEARWLTRDDAGVAWAEERHGPFAAPEPLSGSLAAIGPGGRWRMAPAPVAPAPLPVVALVEVGEGGGVVELLTPGGPERVTLRFADGVRVVAVHGQPVPDGPPGSVGALRPVTVVTHQGIPPGEGPLQLQVAWDEGADPLALEVQVVEEYQDAGSLFADGAFQRPPGLRPNAWNGSDRAWIGTRLPVRAGAPAEGPEPDPDEGDDPGVAGEEGGGSEPDPSRGDGAADPGGEDGDPEAAP